MSEDFDLLFKVVLIGDCSVGKSWYVKIKEIFICVAFKNIALKSKFQYRDAIQDRKCFYRTAY